MADFLDFSRKKSWRKKIVPEKDRVEICGFLGFDFRIFGVPARIFPDFLGFRSENAESMMRSTFSARIRYFPVEFDIASWKSMSPAGFRDFQIESEVFDILSSNSSILKSSKNWLGSTPTHKNKKISILAFKNTLQIAF